MANCLTRFLFGINKLSHIIKSLPACMNLTIFSNHSKLDKNRQTQFQSSRAALVSSARVASA